MNATTPEAPTPTGDVCYMRINVAVPRDEQARRDLLDTVNRESGLDDSGSAYDDFTDPDEEEFDVSEFAFFLLNNRDVSPAANEQVTDIDYDVEEVY